MCFEQYKRKIIPGPKKWPFQTTFNFGIKYSVMMEINLIEFDICIFDTNIV